MAKTTDGKPVPAKGKDLAAFRAAHDRAYIVPNKISAGLLALGDSWEYEGEFLRRCGIASHEMLKFRDQFADFIVEVPRTGSSGHGRRVWAGTRAFAKRLRESVA